jgi:hypothetical protein
MFEKYNGFASMVRGFCMHVFSSKQWYQHHDFFIGNVRFSNFLCLLIVSHERKKLQNMDIYIATTRIKTFQAMSNSKI